MVFHIVKSFAKQTEADLLLFKDCMNILCSLVQDKQVSLLYCDGLK